MSLPALPWNFGSSSDVVAAVDQLEKNPNSAGRRLPAPAVRATSHTESVRQTLAAMAASTDGPDPEVAIP
jgi:hypothetical protein